jgi:hypothetical protein
MREDPIAKVLDDLMILDDILACMVARRNMVSVMPTDGTDSFKPEIYQIWDDIKRAMDGVFLVINECRGIGKMNFEVYDYDALLYVFADTDTALVAIVPRLANKGLIEIEMENARRKIEKIREEEQLVA